MVGFLGGILYGGYVISANPGILDQGGGTWTKPALLLFAVAGAASIALAGPMLSVDPYLWLEQFLETAPAGEVFGAILGVLVGLAISALVAILLSGLPFGIGFIVSVILAGVLVFVGVKAGVRRRKAFASILMSRPGAAAAIIGDPEPQDGAPIIVDTSVLIDGRIVDVAKTGFIQGRLILAGFVLEELQHVADSGDPIKRARGRRGLAVVDELRQSRDVVCEVIDDDFPGTTEVDAKLIKLGRLRNGALMTNDYNLNRIASVEGLKVLNLNDLVNALKPMAATGEKLTVTIVKDGKEPHQGVGYLDDGTMVVVENGRNRIDETLAVTVTSILQTAAGRMIFAIAEDKGGTRSRGARPKAVNP